VPGGIRVEVDGRIVRITMEAEVELPSEEMAEEFAERLRAYVPKMMEIINSIPAERMERLGRKFLEMMSEGDVREMGEMEHRVDDARPAPLLRMKRRVRIFRCKTEGDEETLNGLLGEGWDVYSVGFTQDGTIVFVLTRYECETTWEER